MLKKCDRKFVNTQSEINDFSIQIYKKNIGSIANFSKKMTLKFDNISNADNLNHYTRSL